MATMNVSLPDELKHWAEGRVWRGRYANLSDYIRDLIRRDRERDEARTDLRRAISAGLLEKEAELGELEALLEPAAGRGLSVA